MLIRAHHFWSRLGSSHIMCLPCASSPLASLLQRAEICQAPKSSTWFRLQLQCWLKVSLLLCSQDPSTSRKQAVDPAWLATQHNCQLPVHYHAQTPLPTIITTVNNLITVDLGAHPRQPRHGSAYAQVEPRSHHIQVE
jgi:hypothetical protein